MNSLNEAVEINNDLFQSHEWFFGIQKIFSGKKKQLRQHGNHFEQFSWQPRDEKTQFSWQPRDEKTEFFLVTGKNSVFLSLGCQDNWLSTSPGINFSAF